jgi:hypothetical protein
MGEKVNGSEACDQKGLGFRFMRSLWMPGVQEGRKAFPQGISTGNGFVQQRFLVGLAADWPTGERRRPCCSPVLEAA